MLEALEWPCNMIKNAFDCINKNLEEKYVK